MKSILLSKYRGKGHGLALDVCDNVPSIFIGIRSEAKIRIRLVRFEGAHAHEQIRPEAARQNHMERVHRVDGFGGLKERQEA